MLKPAAEIHESASMRAQSREFEKRLMMEVVMLMSRLHLFTMEPSGLMLK